jgi:hypothetical protein
MHMRSVRYHQLQKRLSFGDIWANNDCRWPCVEGAFKSSPIWVTDQDKAHHTAPQKCFHLALVKFALVRLVHSTDILLEERAPACIIFLPRSFSAASR